MDAFDFNYGAAELLQSDTLTNTAAKLPTPGTAIQRAGTQYVQAISVQNPRSLRQVEKDLMEEAELLGESAYYAWTVKDKRTGKTERIEGPSIGLAMAAVRSWRNCAVEQDPVLETPTSYQFNAAFVDIERGVVVNRPFRQDRAWAVGGNMDAARKEDIRFQIGASKATRNVVLNYIPKSLTDKAVERAKAGVRFKIEDYVKRNSIVAAQEVIIKELRKVGVSIERVLAAIERQTTKAIDIDDIVRLKGDLRAIQEGSEFAESLFPEVATKEAEEKGKATTDEAKSGDLGLKDRVKKAVGVTEAKSTAGDKWTKERNTLLSKASIKEEDYLYYLLKVIGVEKEDDLSTEQRASLLHDIETGAMGQWLGATEVTS